MKKAFLILIVAFSLTTQLAFSARADSAKWSVYFSPHGGCTKAIVNELNSAKESVLVQAFSMVHPVNAYL